MLRHGEGPAAVNNGVVIYAVLPVKQYLERSRPSCSTIRGGDDDCHIGDSLKEHAALKRDGELPANLRLSPPLPVRQGNIGHVDLAAFHGPALLSRRRHAS